MFNKREERSTVIPSQPKKNASQEKTLVFFHIAKTAGTTLHAILSRKFSRDTTVSMNTGANPKCVDEFKHLSEQKRAEIRYLHAHMVPINILEYLRYSSSIVLIRDPVDRVISEYFYIWRTKIHPLHDVLVSKNMSLYDFVTSGVSPAAVHNGQTRLLSGVSGVDWATGAGPISRDVLESAKENLRHYFTLVGLTERFDEVLVLLKHTLGWNYVDLRHQKQNVTQGRPRKQDVSNNLLRLLQQYNEFDLELYQFAKQQFDGLINEQGPFFPKEIQLFQVWNRMYNQLIKVSPFLGSMKRNVLKIRKEEKRNLNIF